MPLFKDFREKFFPRPNRNQPPPAEAESLQPDSSPPVERQEDFWNPDTKLMDLTGHGDYYTVGNGYNGTLFLGGTGSGKTSATISLLIDFLTIGVVGHQV